MIKSPQESLAINFGPSLLRTCLCDQLGLAFKEVSRKLHIWQPLIPLEDLIMLLIMTEECHCNFLGTQATMADEESKETEGFKIGRQP